MNGIYVKIISKVVYEYRLQRSNYSFDLTFINVDSTLVRCTCDDDIDEDYAKRSDRRLQLDLVISPTTSLSEITSVDTVSSEGIMEVQIQSLGSHSTSETQVDSASDTRSLSSAKVSSHSHPNLSKSTSMSSNTATATTTATTTSRAQAGDQGMGSVAYIAASLSSQLAAPKTIATNDSSRTTDIEPASKIRRIEGDNSSSSKSKSSSNQQVCDIAILSVGEPGQMSLGDPVLEQQAQDVSAGGDAPQNTAKPWHSPADIPHRKAIRVSIILLLELKKPNSADWRAKLSQMAAKLEETLYSSVNSVDEYADITTLKARLQQLAIQMGGKQPDQMNHSHPAQEKQAQDVDKGEKAEDRQQQAPHFSIQPSGSPDRNLGADSSRTVVDLSDDGSAQ